MSDVLYSIPAMIKKAKDAQRQFENMSQAEVDAIVRAIGKVVYDHAEELSLIHI